MKKLKIKPKKKRLKKIILPGSATQLSFFNPEKAMSAIFPIILTIEGQLPTLAGTGFFISENGLFVTARHTLLAAYDEHNKPLPGHGLLISHRLTKNTSSFRPIEKAHLRLDLDDDIGLGQAGRMTHNITGQELKNTVLPMRLRELIEGEEIACYGFPACEAYWQGDLPALSLWPSFYSGKVVEKIKPDRYQTDMHIHGGASGAPVFGKDNRVVAICRSSFAAPDTNLSFITPLRELLGITLPDVQAPFEKEPRPFTVAELAHHGYVLLD